MCACVLQSHEIPVAVVTNFIAPNHIAFVFSLFNFKPETVPNQSRCDLREFTLLLLLCNWVKNKKSQTGVIVDYCGPYFRSPLNMVSVHNARVLLSLSNNLKMKFCQIHVSKFPCQKLLSVPEHFYLGNKVSTGFLSYLFSALPCYAPSL